MAKVDADLLKQALLNVVLNGAQAMAEGGKLEVRLAEDGRMALLSIHDQGSGIPNDVRDKIFDLYFTTKKDGSGIGLAMTYRIVELHNGSIEVESDAIRGTTFILRFPLNTLQEASAWIPYAGREQRSRISRRQGAPGMRAGNLARRWPPGPAGHSVYRVPSQHFAARAGASAAFTDRKRHAEPTEELAAAGEDRYAAGLALAAAIGAERAATAAHNRKR